MRPRRLGNGDEAAVGGIDVELIGRKRAAAADVEGLCLHRCVIVQRGSAGEFTGCTRFRAWHPEAGNRYSGSERAPHRGDDAVLGRLVEIGVHR